MLRGDGAPNLLLLNLQLPSMQGDELVQVLRSHEGWAMVPIVMLSSSISAAEAAKSPDVSRYLDKPSHLECSYWRLAKCVVASLTQQWLEQVRSLPHLLQVEVEQKVNCAALRQSSAAHPADQPASRAPVRPSPER